MGTPYAPHIEWEENHGESLGIKTFSLRDLDMEAFLPFLIFKITFSCALCKLDVLLTRFNIGELRESMLIEGGKYFGFLLGHNKTFFTGAKAGREQFRE